MPFTPNKEGRGSSICREMGYPPCLVRLAIEVLRRCFAGNEGVEYAGRGVPPPWVE